MKAGNWWIVVVVLTAMAAGCSLQAAPHPTVYSTSPKMEKKVVLFIPETEARKEYSRHWMVLAGMANALSVPIGKALEDTSMASFTSLYRDLSLVRKVQDARDYDYLIEPKITAYDVSQLAQATLSVHLQVTDRSGRVLLDKDYTGVSETHGGGLFLAGAMYASTALTKGCEEAFEFVFKAILSDLGRL